MFQLSGCPPEPHVSHDPEKTFCSRSLPVGDALKRVGRETARVETRGGDGSGLDEGAPRSLGTWRARLTWRRLRGEGSAVRELHCEHKAKEGEGRDQAVARLASLGPPLQKENSSHTHKFWVEYLTIPRSHCEVYLQVGPLFYAFSAGLCQLFRGTRVCVCVCACV